MRPKARDRSPLGRSDSRRREIGDMRLRASHLLALGGLVLIGLFYWKPIHSYFGTREVLTRRETEVAKLREQKRRLELRLASVGTGDSLVREARRMGLVKPGERLFIVRGISGWRAKH